MDAGRARGPYGRTAARRAEIVRAARDCFVARGVAGTSLRDIAERAGISHATLLYHFPSKDELLLAVLAARDEEERQRSGSVPGDLSAATSFIQGLLTGHQEEPELMRLWAEVTIAATRAGHPAHDYSVARYREGRALTAAFLDRVREDGRLRPGVDPDAAAALLAAVLDGLQTQWLLDPEVDVARCLEQFFGLVFEPGD